MSCLGKLKDFPDYFETVLIPSMISRDQGIVGRVEERTAEMFALQSWDKRQSGSCSGTSHCAGRHDGNRNPGLSQHMKWNTTGVCVEYLILSPSFFTFHI